MALRGVPWAVGGGAHNPVEGARLSLYAATQGARGVVQPTDMRVTALPVPGGAVRVLKGAAVMPNNYQGAGSEAYAVEETLFTDFPIPATGSSGGVTRYLVVRVEDPQFAGDVPEDVEDGPYTWYEWLTSDPETTPPAYPWVLLASVAQPANTQTITAAMISDRRELANPRRDQVVFGRPRLSADANAVSTLTARNSDGGEYFPGGSGFPNTVQIDIPEWATRMHIDPRWMSVWRRPGDDSCWGYYWMEFGDEYRDRTWPGNRQWEFATQKFGFNFPNTADLMRTEWSLMDAVPVPAKLRGKRCTFAFKAGLADNSDFGVRMDAQGGLGVRIDFTQVAEDIHTV